MCAGIHSDIAAAKKTKEADKAIHFAVEDCQSGQPGRVQPCVGRSRIRTHEQAKPVEQNDEDLQHHVKGLLSFVGL